MGSLYDVDFRDVVKRYDNVTGKSIFSAVDFLVANSPFNVLYNQAGPNTVPDSFTGADMVVFVTIGCEIMRGVHTTTCFVLHYNLEIGKIFAE